MTLKEIERQLNDGDCVVLTSGEHYGVSVNIDTDYWIYDSGSLMYFLTMFGMHNELNNICVHRLHFDKLLVETFKLDLSPSELAEINSVYK